jgi:hypothetical protein
VDYAQQLRDAKKLQEDQEAKIKQSEMRMAGYLEKAQAAAAQKDQAGSFLAATPCFARKLSLFLPHSRTLSPCATQAPSTT